MTRKILECVPNFSEGRDMKIINGIAEVISSVDGVTLLDVDPGRDTNRTVITFAGDPDAVSEAAFLCVKKAAELIDMTRHHGAHPRMGATDVLPFVPVSGITMEESVEYARKVASRIGEELGIPVYCYENAAFTSSRKNLSDCRSGEYEGLPKKLADPEWRPDFGPSTMNDRSGATAVGARDFLVAFNINLNTTSTRKANAIAFDVREKGRRVKNDSGEFTEVPGSLKKVKAIGWFLEEYGFTQISMNLTDISVTPVHVAFDEVCLRAQARGVRVTGSELVGLIPLKSLLDAGKHYLELQERSSGVSDEELIRIAARSMGLNDIRPFKAEEKIIEYVMASREKKNRLVDMSLIEYMNITASESPVPGGGSASAYIGSLGAALGTMVANLSANKKGWESRWKEFSDWAEKGKIIQNELLQLVDDDTRAYRGIMEAHSLPASTDVDKSLRHTAMQEATKKAMLVPFRLMETAFKAFDVLEQMIEKGNPNSLSDAGVGALAVMACIRGAFLNVSINSSSCDDKEFVSSVLSKGEEMEKASISTAEKLIAAVKEKIAR